MTATIARLGRVVSIVAGLGLAVIALRAIALGHPVPIVMGALLLIAAVAMIAWRDR